MANFECVIRGGTVATANDIMQADVGISGGQIAAIGRDLPAATREIDASGKVVVPGGVDTHAHIEQVSSAGLLNADTWESATRSAALGGTTGVIAFAAQHRGDSLTRTVEAYAALARAGSIIDYNFHLNLTDPTPTVLEEELPPLVKAGHSSIKVFMTYDLMNIGDEALLDVLLKARELGAMVCVHAENHGMISWMGKRLVAKGHHHPKFHAISHPRGSEAEAFHRLIACAELIDQPITIFHVATREGAAVIREARGRGVKVFGETCTQYLFLTANDIDKPGIEGAKWVCSPPLRSEDDQAALWQALELGDLQMVTSDHAPYRMDETGKLKAGPNPNFKQMANGMPGLEARLPMLFDAIVSKGRGDLRDFVRWTATAPAENYGLAPKKGTMAIGADADIAVWDPKKTVTLSDELVQSRAGYTPFAGRTVTGWPVTVLRRGDVIVADGVCSAEPGTGRLVPRTAGLAAKPTGRLSPEFDSARNFGIELYD